MLHAFKRKRCHIAGVRSIVYRGSWSLGILEKLGSEFPGQEQHTCCWPGFLGVYQVEETSLPASDAGEDSAHSQNADDLQQLLVELIFSVLSGLAMLAELDADVDQGACQLGHSHRGQRTDEESDCGNKQHLQEAFTLPQDMKLCTACDAT